MQKTITILLCFFALDVTVLAQQCVNLPHNDVHERVWVYQNKINSILLKGNTTDTFAIKISFSFFDKNNSHLFDLDNACLFFTCKNCVLDDSAYQEVGTNDTDRVNIDGRFSICPTDSTICRFEPDDKSSGILVPPQRSCYFDTTYVTMEVQVWQTHDNVCTVPSENFITRSVNLSLFPGDTTANIYSIYNLIGDTLMLGIDTNLLIINYTVGYGTPQVMIDFPYSSCSDHPANVALPPKPPRKV